MTAALFKTYLLLVKERKRQLFFVPGKVKLFNQGWKKKYARRVSHVDQFLQNLVEEKKNLSRFFILSLLLCPFHNT